MIAGRCENIGFSGFKRVARGKTNIEIQMIGKFPGLGFTTTTDIEMLKSWIKSKLSHSHHIR